MQWIAYIFIIFLTSCTQVNHHYETPKAHKVGNGGDAVTCEKEYPEFMGSKTAMLYDYYEARNVYEFEINLQESDESVDQLIQKAIKRISKIDPIRGRTYQRFYSKFWDETAKIKHPYFPVFYDDGPLGLPGPDCQVEQAAYQQIPVLKTDKRYFINWPVWERLDNENRAGLVMHEIIYRETLSQNEKDSRTARYFNGIVASDRIKEMSLKTYADLLENRLNLPAIMTFRGLNLRMKSVELNRDRQVIKGQSNDDYISFGNYEFKIGLDKTIDFHKDGSISWQAEHLDLPLNTIETDHCRVWSEQATDFRIRMRQSGVLHSIRRLNNSADTGHLFLKICDAEQKPLEHDSIRISLPNTIEFNSDGIPEGDLEISPGLKTIFLATKNSFLPIESRTIIQFSENGLLDIELPESNLTFRGTASIDQYEDKFGALTILKTSHSSEIEHLEGSLSSFKTSVENETTYFVESPWKTFSLKCVDKGDDSKCLIRIREGINQHRNPEAEFYKNPGSSNLFFENITRQEFEKANNDLFIFAKSVEESSIYNCEDDSFKGIIGENFSICSRQKPDGRMDLWIKIKDGTTKR